MDVRSNTGANVSVPVAGKSITRCLVFLLILLYGAPSMESSTRQSSSSTRSTINRKVDRVLPTNPWTDLSWGKGSRANLDRLFKKLHLGSLFYPAFICKKFDFRNSEEYSPSDLPCPMLKTIWTTQRNSLACASASPANNGLYTNNAPARPSHQEKG